jgi:hypothetical protein
MKKFFSSILFWQCFAALLAVCMVNVPFTGYYYLVDKGPSWFGLDVSYSTTLNYALIKHWVWGKDIICTYGPLAYFSTRIGWGISRWVFVLFDAFIVVNFYFVFIDFLKSNTDKFLAVAVLICTMLAVNQYFGADQSWVLLLFIIYWMIRTFYDQRLLFMAILILFTVLAFYVKMNTGLIAILFLYAHFINLFVCKKITLVKLLIYCVAFAAAIIITAALQHVSIINYIYGSLETIKGYNDVMYLHEDHQHLEYNLYILFSGMMVWFLYILWWQIKEKKYNLTLYTIACMLFIFLLQKQSVLRNDVSHLHEYFSYAPLILLCGLAGIENKKPHLKYSLVIVLFALFFAAENRTIDVSFKERITGPANYIKQFREYNSFTYMNQQDKRYIPQRVLNVISNKTVDVFPWDSEYALENKLNYSPRPDFQSYAAYTAGLENINYDYYVKKAPNFLIYSYDAIDNRYPFNEESLVNLFILNNYMLVDTFTSNEKLRVILQRNYKTVPLQFTRVKKGEFSLKDTLATDHINFIKLDIQYNLAGKIMSFLNKPSQVSISYMREDGKWFTYKTSVELLKCGVFVDAFIANDDDYLSVLTGKKVLAIKKIKLEVKDSFFSKEGQIETYFVNRRQNINLLSHP